MAQQATDKKGNKVKFIRKNGKVIPIKSKGKSGDNRTKKKGKSSFEKSKARGIDAGKKYAASSRRQSKLERKAERASTPFRAIGAIGGMAAGFSVKGGKGLALGAIGALAGSIGGSVVFEKTKKGKSIRKKLKKRILKKNPKKHCLQMIQLHVFPKKIE